MNHRAWAYLTLQGSGDMQILVQQRVHSAGSLRETPRTKPFVILRFGDSQLAPAVPVLRTELNVWAHDDYGGYMTIDAILETAREVLQNAPVPVMGWTVDWMGDSADLADDGYDTITKYSSFLLKERTA